MLVRDAGLLLLRAATGTILIAHGYTKLFGGPGGTAPDVMHQVYGPNFRPALEAGGVENFAKALEAMDVPEPKLAATASGLAEFGGGLGLLLGLATPLAAAAAGFNMWVAARRAHWEKGLYGPGGYEFPLLVGAAAVAIGIIGPGALSLDALRGRGRG